MPINHHALTPDDIHALTQALSDDRPRVRQRAIGILLWHQRKKINEIVREVGMRSPTTLYNWIAAYRDGGIESLARPRSGPPPLATPDFIQLLEDTVLKRPRALGVDRRRWTVPSLNAYLHERTRLALSDQTLRRLLHARGYRCEPVQPKPPGKARPRKASPAASGRSEAIGARPIAKRTRAWQKVSPTK